MTNPDTPNFAAWSREELAAFSAAAYLRMQAQDAALEQLRLDLKDAMKLLRDNIVGDDWK
jgi:hypothetical protein